MVLICMGELNMPDTGRAEKRSLFFLFQVCFFRTKELYNYSLFLFAESLLNERFIISCGSWRAPF